MTHTSKSTIRALRKVIVQKQRAIESTMVALLICVNVWQPVSADSRVIDLHAKDFVYRPGTEGIYVSITKSAVPAARIMGIL